MAYLSRLGKFLFKVETTFAVDPTPATYIPLMEKPSLDGVGNAYFEAERMPAGDYEEDGIVGHQSESTLGIKYHIHGWSTTAPGSLATGPAAIHPDAELITAAVGNAYGFDNFGTTGYEVWATLDVNKVIITMTGDASLYEGGECIAIHTTDGSTPKYEPGVIKTVTGDAGGTLTCRQPFDNGTISTDTLVHAGTTIYPTDAWQKLSYAFALAGQKTEDFMLALGSRPSSLKISATPRDFGTVEIDWLINQFTRPNTGGAPTYTAYSYPARKQVMGGYLKLYDGSANITLDCSTFEFDLGLEISQPLDPTNAQGAGDPVRVMTRPRFSFNPRMKAAGAANGVYDKGQVDLTGNDLDPKGAYDAGTSFDLLFSYGNPGSMFILSVPNAKLVQEPIVGDRDSLVGYSLVFAPRYYDGDTGTGAAGDNNPIDKDWCIGFV